MGLDKKQKLLLPLITIAFVYIAWNLYALFSDEARESKMAPAISTQHSPLRDHVVKLPKRMPVEPVAMVDHLSTTQARYIELVEQYQLIKLKRLVAEEQAAAMQAEQKIIELGQQLERSGHEVTLFSDPMDDAGQTDYRLVFLSSAGRQHYATLSKQGKFIKVVPGTTLSDGARVTEVTKKGVSILRNGKAYQVDFNGITALPNAISILKKHQVSHISFFPTDKPPAETKASPIKTTMVLNPLRQSSVKEHPEKKTQVSIKPAKQKVSNVKHTVIVRHPATDKKQDTNKVEVKTVVKPVKKPETPLGESQSAHPKLIVKKKAIDINMSPAESKSFKQLEKIIAEKKLERPPKYTHNEASLLKLPKDHYTIQLIGSRDLKEITDFIKANHMESDAYYFHSYYLNKPWYVLVYGHYNSYQDAAHAIEALSSTVQELKPWVRPLTSVHQAIKLYR